MKKLKLSLQNMEGVEVLTREQLKKVMGGDGGSGGSGDGSVCGGTCIGSVGEWVYPNGNGTWEGCLSAIHTYCRSGQGTCYAC